MSNVDLVADAREWLATQGDLVQTHSETCHRWHPACLVSRLLAAHDDGGCTRRTGEWDMRPDPDACRDPDLLAAEVRRLRSVIDVEHAYRLTHDEREAIEWAINKTARTYDDHEGGPMQREALRGLLERTENASDAAARPPIRETQRKTTGCQYERGA